MIAPTAAPAELGEELCLRLGYVGTGAAARIEAAEVKEKFTASMIKEVPACACELGGTQKSIQQPSGRRATGFGLGNVGAHGLSLCMCVCSINCIGV